MVRGVNVMHEREMEEAMGTPVSEQTDPDQN
jgi:hypothetical protein